MTNTNQPIVGIADETDYRNECEIHGTLIDFGADCNECLDAEQAEQDSMYTFLLEDYATH